VGGRASISRTLTANAERHFGAERKQLDGQSLYTDPRLPDQSSPGGCRPGRSTELMVASPRKIAAILTAPLLLIGCDAIGGGEPAPIDIQLIHPGGAVLQVLSIRAGNERAEVRSEEHTSELQSREK